MSDKENLVELYYNELYKTGNPGLHLSKFFWEVFSKEPNKSDIMMFNKLVKLYGRGLVFFSLLDLYDVDNLDVNKYYGLLVYIIKRKIKDSYGETTSYVDLSSMVKSLKRNMKAKKVTVDNPFEEGDDE